MSILDDIKASGYRSGNCQALLYDRRRTDLFPEGYLGKLYGLCLESGRRNPRVLLDSMFGGNPESTFDGIVPFLAQRPLVIVGMWEGETFREGGFAFPVVFCGTQQTERSCFAGYGFLRWTYGTAEIDAMMVLGLAMLFQEFNLSAVHGTRFPENALTKKFTERFGFRQVGEIPKYQLRGEKLVPAVVSTLLREDFERIAAEHLASQREVRNAVTAPAPQAHAEDEMARLSRGEINAVWIPAGSSYMPEVPEGMKSAIVDGNFPGDGVWIYNPQHLTEIGIWVAAGNGRHEDLLAPVRVEAKPAVAPTKRITLEAFRNGEYAGGATIPATAEAIAALEAAFPECELRVKKDEPAPEPKKRGANGGRARAAKLSPEERREIARKAAQKRWGK